MRQSDAASDHSSCSGVGGAGAGAVESAVAAGATAAGMAGASYVNSFPRESRHSGHYDDSNNEGRRSDLLPADTKITNEGR